MNRKLFVLAVSLLIGLLGVTAVSARSATALSSGHVSEVEPNDSPAQAQLIVYGDAVYGHINLSDPVDYFKFNGLSGEKVALPFGDYGPTVDVELFDSAQQPVQLNAPSNWVTLPATGIYYVKVFWPEIETWNRSYDLQLVKLTGDEPNDTMETATPVQATTTITRTYDYFCDSDWYKFEGRAGDVFPITYYLPHHDAWDDYGIYDADGNYLDGLNVLPADGTYYLLVYGWWEDSGDAGCQWPGSYDITFGYPMWISAAVNGLGGNATIKQQDIAMRADQSGKWQLVFDASDVGIVKNLNAIERMSDGSILMSLIAAQNVPGVGKVMPQDIIRFIPTSLGSSTAGTFEMYLDGSDVGLTTSGEKIDAIVIKPDPDDLNPLAISTTGSGAVPRQSGGTLKFKDEDLINFVGTSYGTNSAGKWRMNVDGSATKGMGVEDINSATYVKIPVSRNSRLLMTFTNAFKINGISGGPKDVFDFESGIAVKKLADKKIDALTVGVALTP
ncbi:MAG: hypothetical protein R3C44_21395 [Chloroflexota bacterium]